MRRLTVALLCLLPHMALAQGTTAPNPVLNLNASTRTVNVITKGADPTGVADSAPAFRAAMGSNTVVVVPPGNYLFKSVVSPGCCALDNAAVRVSGLSNFAVRGDGATITIDPSIALSSAFQFDSDTHFEVSGLTIIGSRSGLAASEENVGIALMSNVGFHVHDLYFPSGFNGNGAAFAGDWLVDGTIDTIRMTGVGQCDDMAFLKNVTFSNWSATGAGQPTTGPGSKCVSIINDVPNAATNLTGVSFTQTDGVSVRNVQASNFNLGSYVTSGRNFRFSGNRWTANPGSGPSGGYGMVFAYVNGGNFTSVGTPVQNVVVDGDTIDNNGATISGAGLLISQAAIANGDLMKNFIITNNTFENNTNLGLYADGTAHLGSVYAANNAFYGAAQTIGFDALIAAWSVQPGTFSTLSPTGVVTLGNNVGLWMKDGSGTPQPIVSLSPANITFLRPGSAAGNLQIQNFAGTPEITVQGGTTGGITLNNHVISTATAVPTVSTCGTSPSVSAQSTDHSGTITTGSTAVTACTLNFNITYASNPKCVASAGSGTTPVAAFVSARNGASIVLNLASAMTSGTIDYVCEQ